MVEESLRGVISWQKTSGLILLSHQAIIIRLLDFLTMSGRTFYMDLIKLLSMIYLSSSRKGRSFLLLFKFAIFITRGNFYIFIMWGDLGSVHSWKSNWSFYFNVPWLEPIEFKREQPVSFKVNYSHFLNVFKCSTPGKFWIWLFMCVWKRQRNFYVLFTRNLKVQECTQPLW